MPARKVRPDRLGAVNRFYLALDFGFQQCTPQEKGIIRIVFNIKNRLHVTAL
jgi:hypothetical protein